LITRLKIADADEIRVEPGRRIYLVTGSQRQDVSREPVQARAIDTIALELLSPEDLVRLSKSPKIVQIKRASESFDVEFSRPGKEAQIAIRRSRAKDRDRPVKQEVKGAYATVERAAVKEELLRAERVVEKQQRPPAKAAAVPAATGPRGSGEIDRLLEMMVAQNASDLHLSSGCRPALRIDGKIKFLEDRSVSTSSQIADLVRPIFSEKAKSDFEQKKDADFAHEVEGLARFRVNVFWDRKGIGAVFRQIPIEVIPAEKLGLPKAILDLCMLSKGLVIVTGPTGSGKSTTLASMVDYINKSRDEHIITIEDPIEFVHPNIKCLINQREVATHTMSFKNALRAALREDPDIVLVGEMRDLETISIALETAETGHLVFGTLHTTTAISTVDRIIDQFPPNQQAQIRVMLSETLKGVIAQVLVPKIGGGRVAAMEILIVNTAVTSLIREGKSYQITSVMQTQKAKGMVMMNDSLMMLVQKGLITAQDAWMKSTDKMGMEAMFKRHGVRTEFI
jgi:twitching motility protein PilT